MAEAEEMGGRGGGGGRWGVGVREKKQLLSGHFFFFFFFFFCFFFLVLPSSLDLSYLCYFPKGGGGGGDGGGGGGGRGLLLLVLVLNVSFVWHLFIIIFRVGCSGEPSFKQIITRPTVTSLSDAPASPS